MDSIYYNTNFLKKEQLNISIDNRAFKYGDSFFETIKCISGNPIFWEDDSAHDAQLLSWWPYPVRRCAP